MTQVHATLGNANLLQSFFERLEQICILIESLAHNANTELARDMIARSRLNVLMYGRSGSGKSTLIGTLTNNTEDGDGSTNLHSIGEQAVTTTVTNYPTACGIHFTDRPGIDIPGAQAQAAEGQASTEQMAATSSLLKRGSDFLAEQARRVEWARQLRDLDRRLRSSSAEDRPPCLHPAQLATMPSLPPCPACHPGCPACHPRCPACHHAQLRLQMPSL